jgi:hypothetical protein
MGHSSSKCISKAKRENRVSHFAVKKNSQTLEVTCFACGERCHFARECKNPKRKRSGQENQRAEITGNGTYCQLVVSRQSMLFSRLYQRI